LRVPKVWTALDPGIAVQPNNILAQTESSVIYGLGFALTERITIADGAVQESNFYDYHVPRMNEIPEIVIELMPTNNHPTGVGQMATPLVAPAIANAVAELTGVRLRHTPMTPDRVKQAASLMAKCQTVAPAAKLLRAPASLRPRRRGRPPAMAASSRS
jgi:isoquinoline 1-oxidoreductase subunit beta